MKGDKPESALDELRKKKLVGQLRDERDCAATGKVLFTEPRNGVRVAQGSLVTVHVSAAGENPVTMPSLKGVDRRSAEGQLRQLNLSPQVKTRETDRWAPYTVFGQKPDAGKQLPSGCTVELTVAIPIPPVTVPSYVGRDLREISLPSDGLSQGNVTEVDSDQPGGRIISQSRQPGEVVPRGTAINLVVAADMVYVPEVRNLSLQDAAQKLQNAGLHYKVIGNVTPQSFVGKQDPLAGTRVRRDKEVILWLQVID